MLEVGFQVGAEGTGQSTSHLYPRHFFPTFIASSRCLRNMLAAMRPDIIGYAGSVEAADGSAGQLWVSVAEKYVLTPAELEMLGKACRTADELDRLERAVRALPELTVPGSMGQPKPHPLLAEVRAHRLLWSGSQRL
jgi:hypothetical protein